MSDETSAKVICLNCNQAPATTTWVGEGGALAYSHGFGQPWCLPCVQRAQLAYAKKISATIPQLEQQLDVKADPPLMKKPWPKPPIAPEGWKNVGVEIPNSVAAIINAANGADPAKGGMPFAMASIMGALPWIAVALFEALPRDEYDEFAKAMKAMMQQVWQIAGSENPRVAFDAEFEAARKSLQ